MKEPKLINVSKKEYRFKMVGKGGVSNSFIYNVDKLPENPEPKKIVVEKGRWVYEMSWIKFGKQTAIGNIALIPWSAFKRVA